MLLLMLFNYFLLGIHARATLQTRDKLEWTALGDSYASGVGTTNYMEGWRCLRYDDAYPMQLSKDTDLNSDGTVLNNCACSGATTEDVVLYQLLDKETKGIPNWSYGVCLR
jgi:lysophospholipase L1-like esterase